MINVFIAKLNTPVNPNTYSQPVISNVGGARR